MKPAALTFFALLLFPLVPTSAAPSNLKVEARIPLHDGGWDILTADPGAHRVLVSRMDGVDAIDTATGAVRAHLVAGTHFHGVTIVPGTQTAVASEADGTIVVFNMMTGRRAGEIKTDRDADATIYEPRTRSVWVMDGESGTISLIDPSTVRLVGKITVGGSLEFPALDEQGHLFVNVEDKRELAEVDIRSRKVIRRIPLEGCEKPTGLAYVNPGVLISACANGLAKLTRAADGKSLGQIPIGPRPDGAFADPARHLAYIPSGGDGTLSVIDTRGKEPRKIATVATQLGGRTGTVDTSTGAVYVVAAKFTPSINGAKPAPIPGSVELLVLR